MRRNYISPEFTYKKVSGTLNMKEESCFLGSKMMKLVDELNIDNNNILYYENEFGEQINEMTETNQAVKVYNVFENKKNNIVLYKDEYDNKSENITWFLEINLRNILIDFILADLKNNRVFEGMLNSETRNNSVNDSIKSYISYNILDKYKFENIDLFILYENINETNKNKYDNEFSDEAINGDKLTNMSLDVDYMNSYCKINFNQMKDSNLYTFKYYFNLKFNRI